MSASLNQFAFPAASIPDWRRLSELALGLEQPAQNHAAQLHDRLAAARLQLAETADDHQAAALSAVVSDIASVVVSDDACFQLAAAGYSHRAVPASAVVSDIAPEVASDDAYSQPAAAGHNHRAVPASAVASDNSSVGGIHRASGIEFAAPRRSADHMSDSSSVGMSSP